MNDTIMNYLKNPSYTLIDNQEMMMDLYLGNKLIEKNDFFTVEEVDEDWKRGELDHLETPMNSENVVEGFTVENDPLKKNISGEINDLEKNIKEYNDILSGYIPQEEEVNHNTRRVVNAVYSDGAGKTIQLPNGEKYYVNRFGIARKWGNFWNNKHFTCGNNIEKTHHTTLRHMGLEEGEPMTAGEPCGLEGQNVRVGNIEKEQIFLRIRGKCGRERITIIVYYQGRARRVLSSHQVTRNQQEIQIPLFHQSRRASMMRIDLSNVPSRSCGVIISNIRIIKNNYTLVNRVSSRIFDNAKNTRTGLLPRNVLNQIRRGELNQNGTYFISLQFNEKYEGCFADNRRRMLPRLLGRRMTKDQCSVASSMRGFAHYGLQNYRPTVTNQYRSLRTRIHPSSLLSRRLLPRNRAIQQCNRNRRCRGIVNVSGNRFSLLRGVRRVGTTTVLYSRRTNPHRFRRIRRVLRSGRIRRDNNHPIIINGVGIRRVRRRWVRRGWRIRRRTIVTQSTTIDVIYRSNFIDMTFYDRISFRWGLSTTNRGSTRVEVNIRARNNRGINYSRNSIPGTQHFNVRNLRGPHRITIRVRHSSNRQDRVNFRLRDIRARTVRTRVDRRNELTLLGRGECWAGNEDTYNNLGRTRRCRRTLDRNVYGLGWANAVYSHIMDDKLMSGTGYVTMNNKLRMYPNENTENDTGSCPTSIKDVQWSVFNSFIKGDDMKKDTLCGLSKLNQEIRDTMEKSEQRRNTVEGFLPSRDETREKLVMEKAREINEKVNNLQQKLNTVKAFKGDQNEDMTMMMDKFSYLLSQYQKMDREINKLDALKEHMAEVNKVRYSSYMLWVLFIACIIGGGIYLIRRK